MLPLGKDFRRVLYNKIRRLDFKRVVASVSHSHHATLPEVPAGEKRQIARVKAVVTTTGTGADRSYCLRWGDSPAWFAPVNVPPSSTRTLFWIPGEESWSEFSANGDLVIRLPATDNIVFGEEAISVIEAVVGSDEDNIELSVRYYEEAE